ncbi:MAG: hypothetical protein HYS26_04375 [Candidatus Kaiserbacteria bacterium]|nr:MAG: hypothetical protein HYS26_04375 [Candidatus Kaiserbacteria bacterium]
MVGLSLSLPWRRKARAQAVPSALEAATSCLEQNWDAAALNRYYQTQPSKGERADAAWRFLFNWPKHPIFLVDHEPYTVPVFADMAQAAAHVRSLLPANVFDDGFLQNIGVWYYQTRNRPLPLSWCGATGKCITRMAAVEQTFRDLVSNEAVEVAIAFFRHVLVNSGDAISDTEWMHALAYMKRMAEVRRAKKHLIREELLQIRNAAIPHRYGLALVIQREMSR